MQSNTLDVQKQRLNQLIELISDQETHLVRLKELCKQAKEQTAINAELKNELKSVDNSIREKDGELKQALNKVDKLNRQLHSYRRTRAYRNSKNVAASKQQQQATTGARHKLLDSELKDDNKLHTNNERRVSFDPLALLLDAALEGELDLVIQTSKQVPDLNASHDECVTALHNAVLAGHYDIAKYLVEAGCDINVQDNDGWTPLHCAASSNNLPLVKLLIENGALIYATTTSNTTPAMECDHSEEGFEDCYKYLMNVQNNLGVINNGLVYALYNYDAQEKDELSFTTGEELIVLRKDDSQEQEWWWAQKRMQQPSDTVVDIKEGYIPRNLVGLYPRVRAPNRTPNNTISQNSNSNGVDAIDHDGDVSEH